MGLLDKLKVLTNKGYSVSFEPIPYDRGVRIIVRFLGYTKMHQVPDWSYIRQEEYVTNILDELVAFIEHAIDIVNKNIKENKHE
jgi:hypothetical protein